MPLKTAIFVFFLAVYLVTMPADPYLGDSQFMLWVCQSLVEDGDVNILNQSVEELKNFVYMTSKYPLVPSLVGVPFYVLGKWGSRILGRPTTTQDLFVVVSFSGPVISALVCVLLFQFILVMGFGRRTAFLAVCCYGLATIAWPHAFYLSTEPISTLSILGAVFAAYLYKTKGYYRWLYVSGVLSGVAVGSREISIVLVPPLLVYLITAGWKKAKNAPGRSKLMGGVTQFGIFLLGLVPFMMINIWYNFARYGVMYSAGYVDYGGKVSDFFITPLLVGLYGLLLSPGKSLFLYCPILVFMFFSIKSFYAKYRAESLLVFFMFLIYLVSYAKSGSWEGGDAFGPRYLLPIVPLLVLVMAPFLESLPARSFWTKLLVILIFVLGVTIQTIQFWSYPSSESSVIAEAGGQLLDRGIILGASLGEFIPQASPFFRTTMSGPEIMEQFYFVPKHTRSLRLPSLLILLGTALVSGCYLVKKMDLLPSRSDLQSFAAKIVTRIRAIIGIFIAHKKGAFIGAALLIGLTLVFYAAFKYVLVPLTQFNTKPFGAINYPMEGPFLYDEPLLTGKISAEGWVLDRAGIRAVELYIDDVKVADAQYGTASPQLREKFPYLPNSNHAGFTATGIDTSAFSNGIHILLMKALSGNGQWTDVGTVVVNFLNEQDYDFWAHLPEAKISGDGSVEETELSIDQEQRRVLLQRLDTTVTFENIPVYEKAFLQFGFAIPEEGELKDKNVILAVTANTGQLLWARSINLKEGAGHARWYDEQINLSQFSNQVVSLTLIAKIPSNPENTTSRVGWSDLRITYPTRHE